MVSPPPGVSSTVRSRRPSPRRTRGRPPDRDRRRSRFGPSPRRWNGRNTRSRSDGGMPGTAVDDAELDLVADDTGADSDAGSAAVTTERRCRPGSRRRARAAPDRLSRAGSVSATSVSIGTVRSPRPTSAPATTSSSATARSASSSAPVCSRLMSRRLPTSESSRSVSSSIVSRNSCCGRSGPVDVVLQQARDRRLDRRERRAQIVRDRGEQRGAQLVGLGQPVGVRRRRLQANAAPWRPRPARRTRAGRRGRRWRPGPRSPRGPRRPQRDRERPVLGSGRRRLAGDGLGSPRAVVALVEDGDGVGREQVAELRRRAPGAGPARRDRAAQAGEGLGVGPGPRGFPRRGGPRR